MNQDTNTATPASLNSTLNQRPTFLSAIQTKVENKFASWYIAWLGKVICLPIFWIEVLLVAYVALVMSNPLPITTDDTNSYTLSKVDLLHGYTDVYRTPVYPYFIRAVYAITGADPIQVRLAQPGEDMIANHVILSGRKTCLYVFYAQLLLWLLTLIPFYKALKLILHTPCLPFFFTLFIGYTFLPQQAWIITEPLAISSSCLFFSLMVFYWNHPNYILAVGINLFAFVMIMHRPAFLILLPLLAGFWIARLLLSPADRFKTVVGFVSLLVSGALLMGYCGLNKKNHGNFSISTVSAYNQLDILINTDFYKKGNNPDIIRCIDGQEREPGEFQFKIQQQLRSQFGFDNIKTFTSQTVKNNFISYLILTVKRMYWEMDTYNFGLYYLIGILDFVAICVLWITCKVVPWSRLITYLFFYTMLFGIFFGAQNAFTRLLLPAIPLFYLLCVRYIDLIYSVCTKPREEFIQYLKSTL